jgi:hypothetical protein
MRAGLIVAVMLALAAGCARKVVLDPSQVPARNDPAWTVRPAPAGAPAPGAPPAAAPTPPPR